MLGIAVHAPQNGQRGGRLRARGRFGGYRRVIAERSMRDRQHVVLEIGHPMPAVHHETGAIIDHTIASLPHTGADAVAMTTAMAVIRAPAEAA